MAGRRGKSARASERILFRLVVVTGALLVVVGSLSGYVWWRNAGIKRVEVDRSASAVGEPQNYLIVGSDSREGIDPDTPGAEALLEGHENDGRRSDTLLLVRVDSANTRVDLVSFPRDLWLTLPNGKKQRINAAYQHGPQAVIDTVEQNFDVPVNHYVEVNFLAFQRLVEALDGVPIYINRPVRDKNSGLNLPVAGCVRLDPYQALAFSRSRHLEYKVGDSWRYDGTGDAGRITRQQVFLKQAFSRMSDLGLGDVLVLDRLAAAAGESVTLDDGLSLAQLISLGKRFRGFNPDDVQTHTLVTEDYTTDGGAKVQLLDEDAAEPIFDIFRGEEPPPTVPPTAVIPEQLSVEVLNATGQTGFASDLAEMIADYSFVVSGTGNPPDGVHATSEIRYPAGAEPSARLLAGYVLPKPPVVEDDTIAPGSVQLIVGKDFAEFASPKEQAKAAQEAAEDDATSTIGATATTVDTTGPVGTGIEVGDPPPGVKCD